MSSNDDYLGQAAQMLVDAVNLKHELATADAPVYGVPAVVPVPLPNAPYSHDAMVALMVANPCWSHAQFAAHFGRTESWMSSVLASEAFQQALDPRRHLVADPSLTATMEERFRALAVRSVSVIQKKLESAAVSDLVLMQAASISIKALGMGQKAPAEAPALPAPSSESVAEKLLRAMDERDRRKANAQAVDVEAHDVE